MCILLTKDFKVVPIQRFSPLITSNIHFDSDGLFYCGNEKG